VSSSRPDTPPAIRFNFLSASLDREVTLEAMRITRRIMTAPAMAGIATDEIAPGVNISADDELLDWVGTTPRPPTIRSAPARWVWTRWRWSMTSFVFAA